MTNSDVNRSILSLGIGNVVIAACKPDQLAYETNYLGHGIFRYYLLERLYGDAADHEGKVTIPRLFDYVAHHFKDRVNQTPVFKGDIVGSVVLGSNLPPRHSTAIPSDDLRALEHSAETHVNNYIQSTIFDLETWDSKGYKYACQALSPIVHWFDREIERLPRLLASKRFKSAYDTVQNKLADLGHLKVGVHSELGEVVEKLGAGTFGTVWKIRSPDGRFVAYKSYHPVDLGNAEKRSRFARGYRAMAQLDHPHVVKVQRFTECLVGFCMDYIEGTNLRDFAHKDLALQELLEHLSTVADTLKHAHLRNVFHRDVKPENIIIKFEEDDYRQRYRPYLTDFDLAWFSTATQFTKEGVGSLIYASPEQLSKPQSHAAHSATTDIYSFGQLLFYFLCRRDPVPVFSDNSRVLRKVVSSWSSVEPAEKIVSLYESCTKISPRDRIQDFRDVSDWIFEIITMVAESDHSRVLGSDAFQKELIFSIIGLSPERQMSPNTFYTKTGAYKIELEFRDKRTSQSDIIMRILATNAPILDGAHSVADVRGALNKKIDFALASFNKVTRHSGTAGVYNIWLEVRGVQLDTDGVEYCRKLLMRTIDCLEGG
jgi:serine/threonine protein kinase